MTGNEKLLFAYQQKNYFKLSIRWPLINLNHNGLQLVQENQLFVSPTGQVTFSYFSSVMYTMPISPSDNSMR